MKSLFKIIPIALFAILTSFSFSQEIKVSNIKAGEYPNYSADLVVRNPDGIITSKVSFQEGDSIINPEFGEVTLTVPIAKNKSILLLVLNHQGYDNRTRWYQNVIRNAVENGLVREGDEIAVQSFDCNRPEYNSTVKQLLYPNIVPDFVSSKEELLSQVDAINLNKKRFIDNCTKNSDIYGALFQALEEYNKIDSELPKSIVILADDFSLVKNVKERGIIDRSVDYNIPIYGITYYQNINRKYGVETICKDSYGKYFLDKRNNEELIANKLLEFADGMIQMASGMTYPINFKSPFIKDGSKHSVKVIYNSDVSGFYYDSPSMSIFEWISANPLIALFIGLGVIILIILVVVLLKKRKKANEEKEHKHNEEMQRMEKLQGETNLKASQQDEEIRRMKEIEKQKEEQLRQEQLSVKKEEEDQVKIQQMKSRGNLPWFTFDYQGQTGSFEINTPDFIVGRDEGNNYRINLPIVSRQHFKLEFETGLYKITDLNSSNGISLNGQKVKTSIIKHGDVVSVGDITLTFHV